MESMKVSIVDNVNDFCKYLHGPEVKSRVLVGETGVQIPVSTFFFSLSRVVKRILTFAQTWLNDVSCGGGGGGRGGELGRGGRGVVGGGEEGEEGSGGGEGGGRGEG